ncbi:hypothetical protein V6C32_10805 [Desulforamulus ruminis]|uniref:hypothetical protein n=1 Tax=Desulforamulus ruminis TaxID=1564 RepID=UPI002FD9B7DD
MRKIIILIAMLFSCLSLGNQSQASNIAGESTTGEVLLGRSIISGYYAIYSNDNGATYKAEETAGNPIPVTLGQAKSVQQSFGTPVDMTKVKEFTRIVIKGPDEVTNDFFQTNGINYIWNPAVNDLETFKHYYTKYIPDKYVLEGTGDLATGKVDVKWGFELNPILPTGGNYAVDITADGGKGDFYINTWSSSPFASASKAWLWTLPVVIEWYGIPEEVPNLTVDEFEAGVEEAVIGEKYNGSVCFTNESTVTDLQDIPVAVYNNGWKINLGFGFDTINLKAGESKEIPFTYTAQAVESVLKAVIDTPPLENKYTETTEDDNVAEISLTTGILAPPGGNGQLSFQAVSQGGKDVYGKYLPPTNRPINTAKWEDMVTATLKPPAPTPPKGKLTSWSITSANITIPVRHPKFSFGTPYPPVSKQTLAMTSSGHTATAAFKETWGIDGFNRGGSAGVYSPIEKRVMAATPKDYNITATYNIHYTYEWQEKKRKCSRSSSGKKKCRTITVTKTGSGNTSGSASGVLRVDGAGKVPF